MRSRWVVTLWGDVASEPMESEQEAIDLARFYARITTAPIGVVPAP